MLKYLFFVLIIIIICLLVNNDLNEKKLTFNEKKHKINILNLSGSSNEKIRNPSNQTENVSKQSTCCNSHFELSDKYTLAKLNKICDLVPIEIDCMSKCMQINETKRKEFDLDVSDKIEDWIEQRFIFLEVICVKIKKEVNSHTKQLLSNALPIELAKTSDRTRLSKEEVFQLVKGISSSLGLNEMNTFEKEILSSDKNSNKFLINKRPIELLSQVRRVGKLLAEENRKRTVKTQSREIPQINQLTQSNVLDSKLYHKPTYTSSKPINYFKNSANRNPIPYHQNSHPYNKSPPFVPPIPYRRFIVDEDHDEENRLMTESLSDVKQTFSFENLQCIELKLDPSIIEQIMKTYPNLTIVPTNKNNKRLTDQEIDDEKSNKRLQDRGFWSFLNSNKAADKLKSLENSDPGFDNNLSSKLIQQFASPMHDNITALASEVLHNQSRSCDKDFVPTISELLSLSYRLRDVSNNHTGNRNDEVDTLCDRILQLGAKMTHHLENCHLSLEMGYMIKHTFNETEISFKFCMNFEFKNRMMSGIADQASESMIMSDGTDPPSADKDRTNVPVIIVTQEKNLPPVDCLKWIKLKSCQNRFVPWFELIGIEELKQLVNNRSIKFNEMNLFRRNVSRSLRNDQSDSIGVLNCKDAMLFENCVKQDLDNWFTIGLDDSRSVLEIKDNVTCEFGLHRFNRVALINNMANRIIEEINFRMSNFCQKLNGILLLNDNSVEKENVFKLNMIKQLGKRYIGILEDQECSENTMSFMQHCIRIYNNHIEPSFVQFYKNLELQSYFYFKSFVSNDHILPRICCAQRQLARCFITATNFKCSKNKERTERLLTIGDLPYCDEINSKMSMSKCRKVLSVKMQKTTSSAFTLSVHQTLLVLMTILFLLNINMF